MRDLSTIKSPREIHIERERRERRERGISSSSGKFKSYVHVPESSSATFCNKTENRSEIAAIRSRRPKDPDF